jgi:hypothetical protein
MKAFLDAGGSLQDLDKLKDAASLGGLFGFGELTDRLGYMDGVARSSDDEIIELTSELLADAIRLAHPDYHPPERQDLARRVTQQLLALQPFAFPAPKPKPPPSPNTNRETPSVSKEKPRPTQPA